MKSKVCLLLNYAPHYRSLIFNEIDLEFDSAFYFGVSVFFPLKKMDYSTLKGFKKELKSIKIFSNIYWQQRALKIAF